MKHARTWMLLLLISATLPVRAAQVLAIKADRVDTVAAGIIENGIIVIRDGRITAVGADIPIPDDAEIIEATDQTVFPGLINPFSHAGLSSATSGYYMIFSGRSYFIRTSSGGSSSNPHHRVVDGLYPHQDVYRHILQAGFTTVALSPRTGTIAGQGTVIRPDGDTPDTMTLSESGLLMSYFSAGSAQSTLKSALESGKRQPSSADPKVAPLARVVKGELPLLIRCSAPGDTVHLLKLIKGYDKLKLALICGPENSHLAEDIAKRKIPVIIPARVDKEPYTSNRINVAYTLAKAGVKIACYPVSDSQMGHADFLRQMAELVKAGLDKETAKKAITLHPAEILGLDYRLGSIEKGKDANLLILSGDPLAVSTRIQRIIIEGKTVFQN